MSKNSKFGLAALALIVVIALVFVASGDLQGRFSFGATKPLQTYKDVNLHFTVDNTTRDIVYGDDVTVMEWEATADAAYLIRTLRFDISQSGLNFDPNSIQLQADGKDIVSSMTQDSNGVILTLENPSRGSDYAFRGKKGSVDFVVTADIQDDGTENTNSLSLRVGVTNFEWRVASTAGLGTWDSMTSKILDGSHQWSGIPTSYVTNS